MCGEHMTCDHASPSTAGSSPRVRGTLRAAGQLQPTVGIIPACAGNTSEHRSTREGRRDHPRVCGEHWQWLVRILGEAGSSPRVRGTQGQGYKQQAQAGIIPACAGNTRTWSVRIDRAGDHPRVCGEHTSVGVARVSAKGSSPRVRGTLARHAHHF